MEKDPEPDGEWCHFGHYMCHFSKYHILFPMKYKTAEEVVQNLQERVFPYTGVPLILQSDNGGEFSRKILEEVLRVWPTPLTLINGSASKVCSFFFKFDFAILYTLKLFRSNFFFYSNVMKLKFATNFTLMMTNKVQCRCGGRLGFCTPSTLHYDWEKSKRYGHQLAPTLVRVQDAVPFSGRCCPAVGNTLNCGQHLHSLILCGMPRHLTLWGSVSCSARVKSIMVAKTYIVPLVLGAFTLHIQNQLS